MANTKTVIAFAVIYAFMAVAVAQSSQGGPHESQGGPHETQGEPHEDQGGIRIQEVKVIEDFARDANWTSCDFGTTPLLSCHDCNTRLICHSIGGILVPCRNPVMPHCNNGICSHVPSSDCS